MVLLHGWALEQATRVLTTSEIDTAVAVQVRMFTKEFCERTREEFVALHDSEEVLASEDVSEAVAQLAEKEQQILVEV